MAKIETGETVILVMHSPREKVFGVLHEINAAGAYLRGIDLNAFDDWTRAVAGGEPFFGMSDYFFPMWRVERIARDEQSGEIPSMAEQFERKTGLKISDF
ncbi:MAG: hypothetical protein M3384_20535 [Acidobacteriota bacterium]|nr:hypothetical protein [Acidobacteriota bacterium]